MYTGSLYVDAMRPWTFRTRLLWRVLVAPYAILPPMRSCGAMLGDPLTRRVDCIGVIAPCEPHEVLFLTLSFCGAGAHWR